MARSNQPLRRSNLFSRTVRRRWWNDAKQGWALPTNVLPLIGYGQTVNAQVASLALTGVVGTAPGYATIYGGAPLIYWYDGATSGHNTMAGSPSTYTETQSTPAAAPAGASVFMVTNWYDPGDTPASLTGWSRYQRTILDDDLTSASNFELPAAQVTHNSGGGYLEYSGTGFGGAARCTTSTDSFNHKVTLHCVNTGDNTSQEVVYDIDLRRDAATGDPTSCYRVRCIIANGTLDTILYYKVVGGTQTLIGADSPSVGSLGGNGTTYTIAAEIIGSDIEVFCNGTSIATISDSSVTSGRYTGLRLQQGTSAPTIAVTRYVVTTPGPFNGPGNTCEVCVWKRDTPLSSGEAGGGNLTIALTNVSSHTLAAAVYLTDAASIEAVATNIETAPNTTSPADMTLANVTTVSDKSLVAVQLSIRATSAPAISAAYDNISAGLTTLVNDTTTASGLFIASIGVATAGAAWAGSKTARYHDGNLQGTTGISIAFAPVLVGSGGMTAGPVTVAAQQANLTLTAIQGTVTGGGGSSPQNVTAQQASLALTAVAGSVTAGAVSTSAQQASLALSANQGTVATGAVAVAAQQANLTLTAIAGAASVGAVTVSAQQGTLTFTAVAGSVATGAIAVTAQVASLGLSAVASPAVPGAATVAAQQASIAFTAVAGSTSTGATSITAQPCVIVLSPVTSAAAPGAVSVGAQQASVALTAIAGSISIGAATIAAQRATLALAAVAGGTSAGAVSISAQAGGVVLSAIAGSVTVAGQNIAAQQAALTLEARQGSTTFGAVTVSAQQGTLVLTAVAGTVGATLTIPAQAAALTFAAVAGAASPGVVTIATQQGVITLTAVPGSVTSSGSPQNVTGQQASLALAAVASALTLGAVAITRQTATITLTAVTGGTAAGAVSITAQPGALSLTPTHGALTPGAAAVNGQAGSLNLSGIAGTLSPGAVAKEAQVASIDLFGVGGSVGAGSVAVTGVAGLLTLEAVPGYAYVGSLPTPADDLRTAGYPGRRSTVGYARGASTSGYQGHRRTSGYDVDDLASAGYDTHRSTSRYRP